MNCGETEDDIVQLVLSFEGSNLDYQIYVACAFLDAQPFNLTPVGMIYF